MSEASEADHLVTGDKRGLLSLHRHKVRQILSAIEFGASFG
jgi:predicted nucleic acid-binding protein